MSFLSSSSILVLISASSASTFISAALSWSLLGTSCMGSRDGFSGETLEGEEVLTVGRASVDPSGDTLVDAELCRGISADVCVVDTGGTFGAVAAAPDTRVALVVVPQILVSTLVVSTVRDVIVVCVVVVTVSNGAELAPVGAVNGGGLLTVFSEVVGGVVGVV